MPYLKWDEAEFIECLEVVPEIDEFEVCYTYNVLKSGIRLILQVWQLESMMNISLLNESNSNLITSYAIKVRGKIELRKNCGLEYLLLTNCLIIPSRFSYLELGGVDHLEQGDIGYNIQLSVNPDINIALLRENT